MVDPTVTLRALQVERVKIDTTKAFANVEAALERSIPQLVAVARRLDAALECVRRAAE